MLAWMNCASIPRLIQIKQEKQDSRGMVPGGPIAYILIEKLPGMRFRTWFKHLDRLVHDIARQYFKDAW